MNYLWMEFAGSGLSQELNRKTMVKINNVLDRWKGTKHIAGQRVQGAGVDCVQLVCAFLDEMAGLKQGTTKIPRLPQQTGLSDHTGIKGAPVFKGIIETHPAEILKSRMLQAGDIVVCKLGKGGGAGHAMIVSGRDNKLIHACTAARKVVEAGIGNINNAIRVYRVFNRVNWHEGAI